MVDFVKVGVSVECSGDEFQNRFVAGFGLEMGSPIACLLGAEVKGSLIL